MNFLAFSVACVRRPTLMDDLNKERIRFNIETVKLLTLLFITTGGGAIKLRQ